MDTSWLIPTEQWAEHALVAFAAIGVTALVVVVHYEGLHWLAKHFSGRAPTRSRAAMLRIMFALLALHIVEIWCYGLTYWILLKIPGTGFVHGEHGLDNLFVVSSCVFPTGGQANPTLMIVALACRLAEHIGGELLDASAAATQRVAAAPPQMVGAA